MAVNRSSVAATFIVAVLLLSARNSAQAPPSRAPIRPPTVTIEGRVFADDTGAPLPNVRVGPSFGIQDIPMPSAVSDGEGRFAFSFVRGSYAISAVKTGYARRQVPLPTDGRPLEIRLQRGAAISGRVVDEAGDPAIDVRVALESPPQGGRDGRTIVFTTTDDLGEYRFGGLSDGIYLPVVVTQGRPTRVTDGNLTYITSGINKTYLPGVSSSDLAQPVVLHVAEERDGVDFLLSAQQTLNQPFTVNGVAAVLPSELAAPPTGTGKIHGRIVGVDGRAIPQANLVLVPPPNPTDRVTQPQMARSGFDGQFEFSELIPGRYRVFASKAGYLPVNAGTRSSDGTPVSPTIELTAGETRDRVDIPLTRFGTMVGHVLDEYGLAVMGARVQALHVVYEAGRRKLVAVSIPGRVTDDRGSYRLFGLETGQYIVSAFIGDVSSEDVPGYARTYFPGVASASDAQFVNVGPGEDLVGLDMALARTRTALVGGRFINAQGQPGGGSLTLMPTWRAGTTPAEAVGARILPDGRFEFRNVPPGEYVIQASRGRTTPWTEGEFGALPVAVNGADLTDLVLQTSIGSAVSGRISFNTLDRGKLPAASAIEITAVPVDPDRSPSSGWANARVRPDFGFEMYGLSGPRRLVVTRLPAGWTVEEIRVGGVDATDRPIDLGRADQSLTNVEVVISDRVSELTGTVTDESNRPIRGAHVIVFAADHDRWFPRSRFLADATTGEQGSYRIAGLPFGAYYVTTASAVAAEGPEAWQDPAFLTAQISRASSLTISEGQRVTRNIRTSSR